MNSIAVNVLECSLNCVRKACDCRSINYKARTHQLYSKNCQLVNVTKTTHPQNLLPDENYDNYQPIEMVFTRFFYRFSKTILREACDKRPIYVLLGIFPLYRLLNISTNIIHVPSQKFVKKLLTGEGGRKNIAQKRNRTENGHVADCPLHYHPVGCVKIFARSFVSVFFTLIFRVLSVFLNFRILSIN